VVTVEDPIEYELPGVNQVQTRPQIGLDFANVLRSILRHDPDIIMVGEIRDRETAAMAVQAALTGHLVLTTLHTNNAASAPPRLLDMGVEDFLLASTLHAIRAQRLIRRLCAHCREPYEPLPELVAQVGLGERLAIAGARLYRPRGCTRCGGTGFFGRAAVVEVMTLSDRLRRLILRRAEAGEIHETALAEGMRTMFQDALDKVAVGVTSLEEALRVAELG
jgi:general secretion pathway protein E